MTARANRRAGKDQIAGLQRSANLVMYSISQEKSQVNRWCDRPGALAIHPGHSDAGSRPD